jgi:mannosyltransferase
MTERSTRDRPRPAVSTVRRPAPAAAAAAPGRAGPARWAAAAIWWAPVATAAAVMAGFGFWGLARQSAMGNDEAASRWAASLSLAQLAHLLRHVDAVHGLYYLLLHGWMAAGTSPAVLRVPSVIAMVAAAALMVILARRLTGPGRAGQLAGLFAGLLVALSPVVSYYAQTARSYALVYACVLGQCLALLSALQAEHAGAEHASTGRARIASRWLCYGALVTVGAYLNEMALLVLAAHAVTVGLARYGWAAVRHWAVTSAVSVALVSPLLWLSATQQSAVSWIPQPGAHDVWILYHDYFGATLAGAVLVTACAAAALGPAAGRRKPPGHQTQRRHPGGVSVPSMAVPLLLVPAGLLLLESRTGLPLYQDRYVLYGQAGAALLAGAGAARAGQWLAAAARRPELIVVPGAVLCLCALLLQFPAQEHARLPASREFNFGGPSFYLAAHSRRGDAVLFMNSFYRKAELAYPAEFRKTSDIALAVPPAAAASFEGTDKPLSAIIPLLLARKRIWVIGRLPSLPSLLLPPGPERAESLLLLSRYTRVTKHWYTNVCLSLWVRTG